MPRARASRLLRRIRRGCRKCIRLSDSVARSALPQRKSRRMISVHAIPQAFPPDDCDRLVAAVRAAPANDARLVGRETNHNLRRASLVWLEDLPEAGWVMDRIVALAAKANRETFRFELEEFAESAQVAAYDAGREGHFAWHSDIGDGPLAARRKLTMVIQLSDPADYEGGRLEIMPSSATLSADTARGAATVFPSYLLHRVTPVTTGTRHSLTIWAHGPAFR
jgi:PKHD-type hydroxylase